MPEFLSDEWIVQARAIREEFRGRGTTPVQQAQINLVIREVPFGEGVMHAHLDTTQGELEIDLEHLENATTVITTDYVTARGVFVDGDPQVAMMAFAGGKVQITGDMTKVLALMQGSADPAAAELAQRMKDITD